MNDHNTLDIDSFERDLQSVLFRFDCFSPDVLRQYYWQDLPVQTTSKVTAHLQVCRLCQDEYQNLLQWLPSQSVEAVTSPIVTSPTSTSPTISKRVKHLGGQWSQQVTELLEQMAQTGKVVVAQLVTGTVAGGDFAVALRGDESQALLYEVEGGMVSIVLQRDEKQYWCLQGQFLTSESLLEAQYVLTNIAGEQRSHAGTLHEDGQFTIENVNAGVYQLLLYSQVLAVLTPEIKLL